MLALVGPTGVGKTQLALQLAARLPGQFEVVAADSRTVYRWMDIGTAKPTLEEQSKVAHHMLNVVDPDESYSLALYQQQALAAIARIRARGRLPLLVGGAGLYVSAVCGGLSLPDVPPDAEYRASMEARAESEGWQALQRELAMVDPVSAERIDPKNVRRVIRALEVVRATGRPFSEWQSAVQPSVSSIQIGLRMERAALFARIDSRIDHWMQAGFVEEVRSLLARGYAPSLPSMSGLGYRDIARYLAGDLSLENAVSQFKNATHQYAKRQMTWFSNARHEIVWLEAETASVENVLALLDRKNAL